MPFPWNDQSLPAHFISPRQIVVASDLTEMQELLPHVSVQAKMCKADVTLVHVIRSSPIDSPEQTREEEMYARERLDQMKIGLEAEGVRCSSIVRKGLPAEVVGEEITRVHAGRLIIGTHGHGPCGQNMIGTVANALLLTATVPVFVIPPNPDQGPRHGHQARILHPVVPSGFYLEGMCFAAEIAHAYGAELTFLHVMPPSNATGHYAEVLETTTRHEVEDFIWPPDLHVRTRMEYGDPVQSILHFSASEDVDCIVMGIRHDFPWWSKQNSHTYQVIAQSRCPVLTFHDRILNPMHSALTRIVEATNSR
ncbi:MAG TPA: universal stress protein [Acidobacteriaceae bacterium]|nr:universal stress protein [Acidobacteriaceae bacterium]